jgi:hypothetical protein
MAEAKVVTPATAAWDPQLLTVVLDCSTAWAVQDAHQGADEFRLVVDALAVLLRAFLALKQANRIAVFGCSDTRGELLLGEPLDDMRRWQSAHTVDEAVKALVRFSSEQAAAVASEPSGASGSCAMSKVRR